MKVEVILGDFIESIESLAPDIVIHGANCFHTMGAGIARVLNDYTEGSLMNADICTPKGDVNKLGTYSETFYDNVFYINLYSQYNTARPGEVAVHWGSVNSGLYDILTDYSEDEDIVLIPPIGCGLAGGGLNDFSKVILRLYQDFKDRDFTLVICSNDVDIVSVLKETLDSIIPKAPEKIEPNKALMDRLGLSENQRAILYEGYGYMDDLINGRNDLDNKTRISYIRATEANIQAAWGFNVDSCRWYYEFLLEGCKCPLNDNIERAQQGDSLRVYNVKCPYHGKLDDDGEHED